MSKEDKSGFIPVGVALVAEVDNGLGDELRGQREVLRGGGGAKRKESGRTERQRSRSREREREAVR